jgi:lipid A oxidase
MDVQCAEGFVAAGPVSAAQTLDRFGAVFAMAMIAATAGVWMAEQSVVDAQTRTGSGSGASPVVTDATQPETMVAGYFGAPFTYASDVRIVNPAENTDVAVKNVSWDGKPFKSPIYYGVRVARWGATNRTGVMVDFTHSKTISRPDEDVQLSGIINAAPVPAKAKIGALFKHLEFSHGHNMLTLNGMLRLASLTPRISPYVGIGGGIALPHTEIQLTDEAKRSYEYQYTGPVAQALAGLELRLGSTSVFFEYKFSFADYTAPLTRLDGHLLFTDLWRQFQRWRTGVPAPGGTLTTQLASHQIISGIGYRFGR